MAGDDVRSRLLAGKRTTCCRYRVYLWVRRVNRSRHASSGRTCAGRRVYQGRQKEALKALHDDLSKALADDEVERPKLQVALPPYAPNFYENYIDSSTHQPFYQLSSMV